jgi:hypothetical protein
MKAARYPAAAQQIFYRPIGSEQSSILLAPSDTNCFINRSRVVLLSPRPAKANQRK